MDVPTRGLQLVLGPMFSGKTRELLRLADIYSRAELKVLIVRRAGTHRQGIDSEDKIASRANPGLLMDCVSVTDVLREVSNNYDVYLVDEGQFLPHIVQFCVRVYMEWKKLVVVAAVNGTWEQRPFQQDQLGQLLPLATDIRLLSAICFGCKKKLAHYTHNTRVSVGSAGDIDIGSEQYQALCVDCLVEARGGAGGEWSQRVPFSPQ